MCSSKIGVKCAYLRFLMYKYKFKPDFFFKFVREWQVIYFHKPGFQLNNKFFLSLDLDWIELKGMYLDHDFYVVVDKQCRTENAYDGSPIQYLYIN